MSALQGRNKLAPVTSSAAQVPARRLVDVRGAVKRFGNVTAVDGLDFHVDQGEIVSLLGPNGAGKTTTIEMCEGFQSPDQGKVNIFGLDPVAHSDEVRSRIGVMLQGGGAYPGIRVREMLQLVASYSADPLDPAWLLQTVGLERHASTPYRRLSGGQQQRLSLACALVGRPELIFLDEPTAGLDTQSRLAVWDLIRSLKRDGVAGVLTTHLLDEAEELSDRVVIIDRGQVVAAGTPAQLSAASAGSGAEGAGGSSQVHLRVEGVKAEMIADAIRPRFPGSSVTETRPGRFTISGTEPSPALLSALTSCAEDRGALITEMSIDRATLEEVFLSLTGREMR